MLVTIVKRHAEVALVFVLAIGLLRARTVHYAYHYDVAGMRDVAWMGLTWKMSM